MQDINQPPTGFSSPIQTPPLNQPAEQPTNQPASPTTSQAPVSMPTPPPPPVAPTPELPPQQVIQTPTPQSQPQQAFVSQAPQEEYASSGKRFLAALIDGIIVTFAGFLIGLPLTFLSGFLTGASEPSGPQSSVIFALLGVGIIQQLVILGGNVLYPVYFIGSRGQTPGKMAMKIKVLKFDQEGSPGYAVAFLRETVGKFLSSLPLGLGFLWMIWDEKKQTWHDKIAGTVVVKAE